MRIYARASYGGTSAEIDLPVTKRELFALAIMQSVIRVRPELSVPSTVTLALRGADELIRQAAEGSR